MYKKGTKCQVCIGCGRCFETKEDGLKGIFVVMQNDVMESSLDDACVYSGNRRPVTVDIGTTTIAMQLHDQDGRVADCYAQVNPQVKYGADVLSRIEAAKEPEVALKLQKMVLEVLGQGLKKFECLLEEDERFLVVIAANTTMTYLLMGYDTKELGQAPFEAKHLDYIHTEVCGEECLICPGLSAFVGGDIVAGILACDMWQKEELTLLIDLGTNGEMVLGNRNRMIACATAAGPAFEGGVNRGVWGADMIRLLAKLLDEGIMDETGLLSDTYFDTGVLVGDVCVTQESIRAIQLAKGAIRAGIEILVREYGIDFSDIDKVVLAGGFGYHLEPKAAARIGLLPDELVDKTIAGGNTALTGARKVAHVYLSEGDSCFGKYEKELVQVLNLAQRPEFEELYLGYLDFA